MSTADLFVMGWVLGFLSAGLVAVAINRCVGPVPSEVPERPSSLPDFRR